jgi:hypothetical protein
VWDEDEAEARDPRLDYQRASVVYCFECKSSSEAKWSGWCAYLVDDPDLHNRLDTGSRQKLTFYCPSCAEREFGDG